MNDYEILAEEEKKFNKEYNKTLFKLIKKKDEEQDNLDELDEKISMMETITKVRCSGDISFLLSSNKLHILKCENPYDFWKFLYNFELNK